MRLTQYLLLIPLVFFVLMQLPACAEESPTTSPESAQQKRLDLMTSKGPNGSLTIFPVSVAEYGADSPISTRVSEVVGLLLERNGLKDIEISQTPFNPTDSGDLNRAATEFGQFLQTNPIKTDYALFADYHVDRKTHVFDEVRAVVVDSAGELVWAGKLPAPNASASGQPSPDPMTLSVLLAQQLGPQFGLNEQTAKAAKPGKMAALIDQRSGLPPESERAALGPRQKAMKDACPKATLAVFPPRVSGHALDSADAAQLVKMIDDAGFCNAVASSQEFSLKPPAPDPNELKHLWDFARQCRTYAKQNPPDADYVLFADYGFNPNNWQQGFVHLVVCDHNGDWVIVDMQNSQWPDYQSIKPTSKADCDRLLLKRLSGYLR